MDTYRTSEGKARCLPELLVLHDTEFVDCAYRTLLDRAPDADGATHFTRRLRLGHSKLEILWDIRRSAEGRRRLPAILGLDKALYRSALARRPIVGPLLAVLFGQEVETASARRQRAVLNEVARLRTQPDNPNPKDRPSGPNYSAARRPSVLKIDAAAMARVVTALARDYVQKDLQS